MSKHRRISILLIAFIAVTVQAQHSHHQTPAEDLGDVQFANSGKPEAQETFRRGLLLLHSFEYDRAAREFVEARRIDPSFAMAYWGEAMTFNHPIWNEQDVDAARRALDRLAPSGEARLAKAPTQREKDYLSAVEVLYGTGGKRDRDAAYSSRMKEIAGRYPDDQDARAFYALSLLGLTGDNRNTENYMRAAAVAEEIYEQNKRHPGALHYLIHAYDDPTHAPLGLRAARLYAKVAPAASHAQHMPSHIFFALGMWDDAIASNIDSLATAHMHGQGGYHPLHWLEYAYLQKGNRAEAEKLVRRVDDEVAKAANPYSLTHQALVRATWLVETGGAAPEAAQQRVDRGRLPILAPYAGHELARGLVAVQKGDLEAANDAHARIRQLIDESRTRVKEGGTTASRFENVSESEFSYAEIMALQLLASIQMKEGKQREAFGSMDRAVAIEQSVTFEYGPPPTVKPLHELYGDFLLLAGKPAEAAAEYEKSGYRCPNRRLSWEGLQKARAAMTKSASGF